MIFEEKHYFFCYILLTKFHCLVENIISGIQLYGYTTWYMVVLAILLQHKSNIEPMKRHPADIWISPAQHRYCSQYDTHDILHSRIGF